MASYLFGSDNALIAAALAGDVNTIIFTPTRSSFSALDVFSTQSHVDVRTPDGSTPLMCSVLFSHTACVRALLDKGASVNAVNKDGNTPLIVAALAGHKNELTLLLEHGANVNQLNYMGSSAMMTACFFGQKECVEVLLAHAATDIELRQAKTGDVALHAAAYTGRHEIVDLLLKKGAKKDAKSLLGLSALDLAQIKGHQNCVVLLQQQGGGVVDAEGGAGGKEKK